MVRRKGRGGVRRGLLVCLSLGPVAEIGDRVLILRNCATVLTDVMTCRSLTLRL